MDIVSGVRRLRFLPKITLFTFWIICYIFIRFNIIKVLDRLVIFLKILFDLTKNYNSLAKHPVLLNQLRTGTLFTENFIQKAIPLLETHFEAHQHQMLSCISNVQRITRQLNVNQTPCLLPVFNMLQRRHQLGLP